MKPMNPNFQKEKSDNPLVFAGAMFLLLVLAFIIVVWLWFAGVVSLKFFAASTITLIVLGIVNQAVAIARMGIY